MKTQFASCTKFTSILGLLALMAFQSLAASLGTTFTYQGRLDDGGVPANGLYDFNFKLYDADTGGALVGPAAGVSTNAVAVSDGVFTVYLDFGNVFDGQARWLDLTVNTNAVRPLNALTPRQAVLPAPYALYAASAGGVAANAVNNAGLANDAVNGRTILNGSVVRSVNGLTDALTLAAGPNITLTPTGNTLTISGTSGGGPAWLLGGNGGTDPTVNFLGTTDDKALTVRVNNTIGLRLFPSSAGAPSMVGGDAANSLGTGFGGSVIAGGGTPAHPNQMSGGYYSFIGSGEGNFLRDQHNVIVGGYSNIIGRTFPDPEQNFIGGGGGNLIDNDFSVISGGSANGVFGHEGTIGGGGQNTVASDLGTVGGGGNNQAGQEAVVGGGFGNHAVGRNSTVAGGTNNVASGFASAVAGGRNNSSSGKDSAIGGGIGNRNTANYTTIGGGYQNLADGQDAVVAGGSQNSATAGQSTVSGGIANLAAAGSSTIAGGQQNTNSAIFGSIGGGQLNFVGSNVVDTIEFGLITNRADFSGIGAGNGNRIGSQYSALSGGLNNQVLGDKGFIGGGEGNRIGGLRSSSATAPYGVVSGGRDNVASEAYATVPGGRSAVADHYGQLAFANGHMDHLGDAQISTYVLRRKFSGNGDLYLDDVGAITGLQVPAGAVWTLRFQISAVSVAGVNLGSYEVSGVIANVGGATTFQLMDGSGMVVGTARPIFETVGAVGWLATPYQHADGSMRVAVFAGETVKWCARIDVTEVTR